MPAKEACKNSEIPVPAAGNPCPNFTNMWRSILATLLCLFLATGIQAQESLYGKVSDNETSEALVGAFVRSSNGLAVVTGLDGSFKISGLESDESIRLEISYLGYETKTMDYTLREKEEQLIITLMKSAIMTSEVVVSATRANQSTPTTYTNMTPEDFEIRNLGQDMPMMLKMTPSMVTTSDAGAGIGYTGLRLRGSDATRINVTINGIPYNDTESQGVFWVDLPDFASSVENIQIQRGVGTSTNGAGAFGGTVSVQTFRLTEDPYAEFNNSIGSFNTLKNTLKFGTGLFKDHWTFDGRVSNIQSDGYIDRASSDLQSYYFSGGYYGKKNLLRLTTFSGKERTYQAWNGVFEDDLEEARTSNSAGTDRDPFYEDEVDNYKQDHYQVHFSQRLSEDFSLNTAFNYTHGKGYFEQYKAGEDFEDYGLNVIEFGDTIINNTDLIRRRWLDNDFYVGTLSLDYTPSRKIQTTLGGAYATYEGRHYGEVIWARYAADSEIRQPYYDNTGNKKDINVFLKANYAATSKLNLYADLQVRNIDYDFLGFDNELNNVTQSDQLSFFNPKFGASYQLNTEQQVYASWAVANKEPSRNDYTESTPNSRPKPETLYDTEIGYKRLGNKWSVQANVYYMKYKDQLVLNGQVNDVGAFNRVNVADSYRAGIELQGAVQLLPSLIWDANLALSQNKAKQFTEYVYTYDDFYSPVEELTIVNEYEDTDLSFSPPIVFGSTISWQPIKQVNLSLLSKYIGKQFLDNTSNDTRSLDAYMTQDIAASFSLFPRFMREVQVSLLLNNVLDELYESNGYTFSERYAFVQDNGEWGTTDRIDYNYYYPQAGFNFLLGLNLKF